MADLFRDILPDLNHDKKHLIRSGDLAESSFDRSRFIVNKAFSMMPDTIFYANEMNHYYDIDPMLTYDYFINSLRAKKRYSKWAKTTANANIEVIKRTYKYSDQKAKEVLSILSDDQLETLRVKLNTGGNNEFYEERRANP